jgi:tetratricopeptide (TPR) repeat protein
MFLVLGLVTLFSCSTKKNTFTRRAYHNLTGHYNMFWNGRESYREGVRQLNSKLKDNYNKILPVYNYGTEQMAQSLNPYMDKAIEKASLNVQKHSMFFQRRERVKWIDDSYMLIGLGYFYKQEYNKAQRTFEFVINEYDYNDIQYDAMLWLANTFNQLEKYKRAESVLDNLENEIKKNYKVSDKVIKAMPLVRADMYLKQEKYNQAKEALVDALYGQQKKIMDARARFILAQIYQQEGDFYVASEYYKQVIKKNPPYEMAFNAAINLATSYDTLYGFNSKPIVKNLKKMLKEDKNIEYRDQIYYALADVSFKDGVDSLGASYLALSVATSVTNNFQKATSSLRLADYYFLAPEYELSQAYYDTAVQVLPQDFPNREDIIAKTEYMTELVSNLLVVETEDSLQKLAAMPEDERMVIIDKLIEDYKKEEERLRELEQYQMAMRLDATRNERSGSSMIDPTSSGGWYFYNTATLSYGFSEFKKKWGSRENVDNWRLSNKEAIFEVVEEELAAGDSIASDSTAVTRSNDPKNRNYYLQDIPLSEEQLAASNAKIDMALFNLGFIYKDKLLNYPEATGSFESLITRFPETENRLQALYQLYRLYVLMEDPVQADFYKNLLVQEYPDSDYAKILVDPDYFKQLQEQRNFANILYRETFEHYEAGHYYTVYSNSTRALKEFKEPMELLARFEYLRALSLGKIEVVDSLKAALDSLVVKYPNSEVTPLAQNILDYLKDPAKIEQGIEPEEMFDLSMYNFNPKSKQIFALVISGAKVNVNALKVRISDFNMKYYSIDNLSITNILLDKNTHFVMVGNFKTIESSMKYYNAIMANEYIFSNLEEDKVDGFVIAQENYPVLYKDKDLEKYLAFFKLNYLEKQ